jgi:hypothetical protein
LWLQNDARTDDPAPAATAAHEREMPSLIFSMATN